MSQANDEEKKMSKEKEVMAMMMNLKEERLYKKTSRLLNIEKDYVMKLVDLDKKSIRLNQKRFKARVGKIKTYLPTDDIVDFKELEDRGKFRSGRLPINIDHIGAVNAVAKRLKILTTEELNHVTKGDLGEKRPVDVTELDGPSRPETPSNPGVKPREEQGSMAKRAFSARAGSRTGLAPPETGYGGTLNRPKSCFVPGRKQDHQSVLLDDVTDARSMHTPRGVTPAARSKPSSSVAPTGRNPIIVVEQCGDGTGAIHKGAIDVPTDRSSKQTLSDSDEDSDSQHTDSQTISSRSQAVRKPRPFTAGNLAASRAKSAIQSGRRSAKMRPKTAVPVGGETLNYSSHKDALHPELKKKKDERRMSLWSSSSIGSELERDKRQEKRLNLLKVENVNGDIIEGQRLKFLDNINKFIEENPLVKEPPKENKPDMLQTLRVQAEQENPRVMFMPEEDALRPEKPFEIDNSIASMSKCRYLRVADEIADLTGVQTLAVEQFKMMNQFKIFSQSFNNKAPRMTQRRGSVMKAAILQQQQLLPPTSAAPPLGSP